MQEYYNGGQVPEPSPAAGNNGSPGSVAQDAASFANYTAADWAAVGYGVAEWVNAGYSALDLQGKRFHTAASLLYLPRSSFLPYTPPSRVLTAAAGYTARDLAESGLFSYSQLLAAGFEPGAIADLDPDLAKAHRPEDGQGNAQPLAQQQPYTFSPPETPSPAPAKASMWSTPCESNQAATQEPGQPAKPEEDDEVDVDELLALLGI